MTGLSVCGTKASGTEATGSDPLTSASVNIFVCWNGRTSGSVLICTFVFSEGIGATFVAAYGSGMGIGKGGVRGTLLSAGEADLARGVEVDGFVRFAGDGWTEDAAGEVAFVFNAVIFAASCNMFVNFKKSTPLALRSCNMVLILSGSSCGFGGFSVAVGTVVATAGAGAAAGAVDATVFLVVRFPLSSAFAAGFVVFGGFCGGGVFFSFFFCNFVESLSVSPSLAVKFPINGSYSGLIPHSSFPRLPLASSPGFGP